MTVLLDTHTFLWFVLDDAHLSTLARTLIEDPDNDVLVSPASSWEIAIKVGFGKLDLRSSYDDFIHRGIVANDFDFVILPIEPRHTSLLTALPLHHKDPFDRLLVAQAMVENLAIVSAAATAVTPVDFQDIRAAKRSPEAAPQYGLHRSAGTAVRPASVHWPCTSCRQDTARAYGTASGRSGPPVGDRQPQERSYSRDLGLGEGIDLVRSGPVWPVDGVLRAVNLGDDADTTGAVCGQLAGAYWGQSGIPKRWRDEVARTDVIEPIFAKLLRESP